MVGLNGALEVAEEYADKGAFPMIDEPALRVGNVVIYSGGKLRWEPLPGPDLGGWQEAPLYPRPARCRFRLRARAWSGGVRVVLVWEW